MPVSRSCPRVRRRVIGGVDFAACPRWRFSSQACCSAVAPEPARFSTSSDPTKSSEYRTVEQKLKASEAQVAEQRSRADVAQRVAAAATAEARELREVLVMGQALTAQRTPFRPPEPR